MEVVILAVTKIIKVKVNVSGCINYVTNDEKTDGKHFVTYFGCQEGNADYFFKAALSANRRKPDDAESVKAYHLIQSFAPTDEINESEAHEIGKELVKRLFGDKYAYVCATHNDKGHLHNHIVVCAAARDMTGKKINDNLALLHSLQRTSDELCREHGLDVIDKKKGTWKHYKEWLEDSKNPEGSKKAQLRRLIDEQIKLSKNFDDFLEHMKDAGAGVAFGNSKKYGRVTKYRILNATEKDRWNRGYNLGQGYSDEMIKKRIERRLQKLEEREALRQERAEARKAQRAAISKADRAKDKTELKISSMIDTSKDSLSSSNIALEKWRNLQNARRAEQIKEILRDKYGIDYTQIKTKISSLEAENNRKVADIERNKSDISDFRTFIEACQVYMDTIAINQRYENSKDPERYYQDHDSALNAYNQALAVLKERRIDINLLQDKEKGRNIIKDLQEQLTRLEEINEIHEQDIKNNQKEINELRKFQKELDIYHNRSNDTI